MRHFSLIGALALSACGQPSEQEYHDFQAAIKQAPAFISNSSAIALDDIKNKQFEVTYSECGVTLDGREEVSQQYCSYEIRNGRHNWSLKAQSVSGQNENPRYALPTFIMTFPYYWESPNYRVESYLIDNHTCSKTPGCHPLTQTSNQIQQFISNQLRTIS